MKYYQAIISGLNMTATDTTVADCSVSHSQKNTYFPAYAKSNSFLQEPFFLK